MTQWTIYVQADALKLSRGARDCHLKLRTSMSPRPADAKKPRPRAWPRKDDRQRSPRGKETWPRASGDGSVILYGWHTVKAALWKIRSAASASCSPRRNAARRLAEDGVPLDIAPELVRPDAIARRLGPDAVHNGLLAEADPLPAPELEDLEPQGIVLVLDQITDPHNVGAILRTAAGFAVAAVVTTARHSPEATGVLAKSASGALDYVPVVTVQNLARALEALRERGYLLVGLDSTGDTDLSDAELRAPLALVLGAEGKGLRQLTRTTCDVVARLDLPGRIQEPQCVERRGAGVVCGVQEDDHPIIRHLAHLQRKGARLSVTRMSAKRPNRPMIRAIDVRPRVGVRVADHRAVEAARIPAAVLQAIRIAAVDVADVRIAASVDGHRIGKLAGKRVTRSGEHRPPGSPDKSRP